MAKCGRTTEIFTRVCGYHRPVMNFSAGKKEEFRERKNYKTPPIAGKATKK